ncbi:MAG: gliding motility-associated C-terminal domain-containing protein [Bacteroidetes bacterium]|nr:gliding motility-associated C-terminal domain-containing protein [Bacteroidota bacterium]
MKVLYTITLLVLSLTIFSQKGKNGSYTVIAANTRINEFTSLTANASTGNTTINVTASSLNTNSRFTSTLTAGDLVMIIQMQGALIKVKPYNPWEAYVTDSLYGQVYSYQNCGNYEFAQVKTVISATQIELECGLTYDYSTAGKTQVVRVPRYSDLTVNGSGTLTTDAWNGTTGIGGVLVAEVDGNTTINGVVTATGLGFRGGLPTTSGGTDFFPLSSATPTNKGSEKGEGIGSDRLNNSIDSLGRYCKGAPGNAGGGGNANNCGGGGGGNGGVITNYNGHGNPGAGFNAIWNLEWPGKAAVTSSGGGKGGYGTSTTTTANINSVGPNSTSWGTFRRISGGGFGGRPLDYSTGKLFMGGGGGAGHSTGGQSNGAGACAGGSGGGLIFLLNYGTISGSGTIVSNGANGGNAFGTGVTTQGIDGAGGAGAGGTIILKSNGIISGITTNANGGNGGNQVKSGLTSSEGQGPGGGGSGGYIAGNGSVFTQNVNAGANGTTNASAFDTEFPMNGATSGGTGTNNQIIAPSFSLTASPNQTLCTNQSATLTATSTNGTATVLWYNAAAGGNSVASGTVYTTPTFTATGTYTVYAGSCPGLYRVPIIITVGSGVTITVNSPTICPGQTVTLTATGATTYTWNTGPTTNTISVAPASTTIYTVNATSGTCVGTQTTQVLVSSTPTISVASATICSGNSATLTATGATNYTWAPGGQLTTSVVVTPTINTTYTITGAVGTCTSSTTASVTITSTPTLATSSRTICAGQVATFTVSGATTYTWNPGNVTGNTYTTSPASSGTVSVIGANGTCTSQVTTSITVTPNPTVAVSNQTICSGQTAILTATGATTYSWNTGATTNTISVAPTSLTIYTVVGTTNSCTNTRTVSVTVNAQPTVAVANASICSGNSTILTATGATNYTWMPGGQLTNTVSVNPGSTTIYTITGATGTCTTSTNATVNVTSTPTLVANSVTICPGQTATLTASGATTYTWNPGNISGTTYTIAPASNTTVSVVGANGTCTTAATVSVTIGTGISISVNNPTICLGQTASLTASGATSYTWSTGPNTNTLNVSPATTTTYVISGTSGACTGSNTAVVTVVSVPSVSVSNAAICSGSSVTLTASGATSYTWSPGGQLTNTISVNPSSTTIYTITGSNGICSNSTTATVSVTATPTLVVASSTICPGQTATLTASGATTYTWNPGNVIGNTFTLSPASNTVVTITGANGTCTSSTTASITIGSGLSITVNSPTICTGETATLTASGATSYTWNPGNLSGSSVTVAPTSNTTYTVVGVNGACSGSNTAIVTIAATPTLATNSTTICARQTTTLTANGATTYTWNPGNLSGASITVTPASNTTYTVVGANGTCTNSATSSVAIINCNNPCQFSLGRDTAFCSPMNFTINGPAGYNSYSWTPGGATTQNITATTTGTYICTADILSNDLVANGDFSLGNTLFTSNYIVPTVPGAFGLLTNPGTYLITTSPNSAHNNFIPFGDHTTGTGNMMVCNGSAVANDIVWSQTISVSPNTNYNFSAWVASVYNTTAGNEAQLQFSINGSLLGSTYSAPFTAGVWANFATNWNSGVSTSAVITIVDQNFTAPGANDFALDDIFYQQVCSHSDTIIVTENVTPTVTASATNSVICNGNPTTLTASGASTYTWTSGVTNGVSFTPTVTATYSVIGTSVEGCTNTAIQTVTVNSTPTIAVNSASICSGQTATLIATGANTYTWSNSVSGSTQTVSPSATTIYTVTGTDVNSCVSTSAASATVGVSATPTITINSASICAGQTVTLTATGATNVTWNTTETTASIFTSPAFTTTYSVVGNNGGCSSTQSTTVSVTPSPTITASVASLSGCAPFCTTFNDVVSSSATGITYNFGDGSTANINNPNHCYLTGGSYTVTATATNSVLGCSSTFTLPVIDVIIRPTADFNISEGNVVTVGTLVNFVNTSTNANTYLWNISCNGSSLTSQNFAATFVDTGSCCINLIAENTAGCSDTTYKCINVVREAVVVIPNVFTPNGDTKNDVFKINSTGLKSLRCVIFNRWGLKMYEWDGLNGFWDGSAQSGKAPDGTYFYIVDYTDLLDNKTTEKGYLNLFND